MRKFMRTRAADAPPSPPPAAPRAPLNGHAGGVTSRSYAASCAGVEPACSSLSGALFEDAEFSGARALGDARLARRVHWPRPHELCAAPRFRGDGVGDGAGDDAAGGEEAARWAAAPGVGGAALCSAAAALAQLPRLMDRVVPPQSFRDRYSGAFRFRFWVFGEWREVVVDDRLPARGARLLVSRATPDDFTLPLLEKAYAKLLGSYAAVRGGAAAAALAALSGGVVQSVELRGQERARMQQLLQAAVPRATLLMCAAPARPPPGPAALAYCVTGLARARPGPLVRVRAAGGRDLLADDPAAGFWLSFDEFARTFSQLDLVHVGPDDWLLEPALQGKRPWRAVLARRRWRPGLNAGGPPSCATAGTNPQFHVQIPGATKCHVVVSVTQQYAPAASRRLHAVGFALYALGAADAAGARRPDCALHGLRPLDVTHESRAREVVTFFTLPPGRYLLVPHTRRAHTAAAFLLRVLTDDPAHVWCVRADRPRPAPRLAHAHCLQGGERRQHDRARRAGRVPAGRAGRAGGRARGGGAGGARRGRARRAGTARGAAARVARVPVRAPVVGAVPRAGGAAGRRAGGRADGARAARAAGAAGVLARRLPARRRRAALRRGARVVVPPARAAVGGGGDGVQQGAGVPGAAVRARLAPVGGGLRDGAGAAALGARAVPKPGRQAEVQPAVAGGDAPDDPLLVRRVGSATSNAKLRAL